MCYQQLSANDNDQSVVEIAMRWGFSNHSHFSRRFKEVFGFSPSDTRDLSAGKIIASENSEHYEYELTAKKMRECFLKA